MRTLNYLLHRAWVFAAKALTSRQTNGSDATDWHEYAERPTLPGNDLIVTTLSRV